MSIARALAVLGAGMQGLGQGEETNRQRRRQEEDDAFRKEQRDRTRTQWQRDDEAYNEAQADKEAERQAMAPTVVQPDLAPNQMGPAGFNAGGKTFANPDQAQAAATTYNAPASGMRRAAAAVRNPTRAADLQARADQAELGAINLDAAKQAQEAQAWDRKLYEAARAPDPKALTDFMTASKADGLDGNSKWAHKVDGANLSIYPVGPDGTALSQGFTIPNTPAGRLELVAQLSRATPITAKLADLRAQQKFALEAEDKRADNARQDKATNALADYHRAMADAAKTNADAAKTRAEGGGGKNLFERLDEADKLQYQSLAKRAETIETAITKAQADGMWQEDSPNAKLLRQQQAAIGLQMRGVLDRARETPSTPDPLGLRKKTGPGAVGAAPAGSSGNGMVSDAESGKFIIQNELGGDLARAEAYAKELDAKAASAGNVESKSIIADEARRVRAGIAAMGQQHARTVAPRAGIAAAAAPPPVVGESAQRPPQAAPVGPESVIGKPPVTPQFQPVPALEQALAKEMLEMAEGKRMKFSTPEIAAYGKARKAAADSAQPAPAGMTELQRAQQLSRQQLGKA